MIKIKVSATQILGLIGSLIWCLTIIIRGSDSITDPTIIFLLGIAPNFGSTLLLAFLVEMYYPIITKKKFDQRIKIISLVLIFIAIIGSEVFHDLFLNSSFDINDILATITSLIIIYITSIFTNKKIKYNETPYN